MYDWANSVYSLTIATAVFPIYYDAVTRHGSDDKVMFLGREYVNSALYSYALSFAFLFISIISPLLSSIADYRNNKHRFMEFFCYVGAISCATLFWFDGDHLFIGILSFILATIGFCGSLVFYNAYLPEIAEEKDQDRVSALGFSLGYAGSVILLIVNLMMIQKPEWFGMSNDGLGVKISFVLVGIWWAGFAQLTFSALRKLKPAEPREKKSLSSLAGGYRELAKVWKQLKSLPRLSRFLLSFFFYIMAVQTVMYIAGLFGDKELHLPADKLIITILVIQLVAIGGAYLFSKLSSRFGNIRALMIAVVAWIGICIGAWFVYDFTGFVIVAFCVGMVMGGIQSLSRSTYSKMLPETNDHASFFSFYAVTEKLAIVFGTLTYGLIEELTGSMRNSILALIVFFILGLIGLMTVKYRSEAKTV